VRAALVAGSAVLGTAIGACLDLVITRVPRRQALLAAGARHDLRLRRAVLLAVACGALFAGIAARLDDSWALPAFLVLAAALVVLSLIDLEHFLLPNRIVYPLAGATVVLLALGALGDGDGGALLRALLGGVAAFVALAVLHLLSPRSMGFGDVKLAFVLGLALGWLGWGEVVLGLFLAFLFGAVVGVALIALRRRGRKDHVPFGPFLAAGTMTAVLWGDAILDWYRAS
jgi:leader peptidase (prepilin peptidase) / N-methyltransferase